MPLPSTCYALINNYFHFGKKDEKGKRASPYIKFSCFAPKIEE